MLSLEKTLAFVENEQKQIQKQALFIRRNFKKTLDFYRCVCYNYQVARETERQYLGVAQLVARYLGVVEAARSSRVTQTSIKPQGFIATVGIAHGVHARLGGTAPCKI